MIVRTVYRVGQSVFTEPPDTDNAVELTRLIAEEGRLLVNGDENACCVDVSVDEIDSWREVDERLIAFGEEEDALGA